MLLKPEKGRTGKALTSNDLTFVAGAVMPLDRIKKNDASYNAGFFGSKLYTDQEQAILDSGVVKKIPIYDRVLNKKSKREVDLIRRTDFFNKVNHTPKPLREAAARIAEEYRLVKGRKSPTGRHRVDNFKKISRLLRPLRERSSGTILLASTQAHDNEDILYRSTEQNRASILNQNGKKARGEPDKVPTSVQLMHRDWNETYKLQVITETPSGNAPAENVGVRFTDKLNPRAVSRIFEAGAYTAACHGGFTTFLTLTFSQRKRLELFGGMVDEVDCNTMGSHHPIRYRRNMVTAHPKRGEKKIWDSITEIGGEYCTVPSKDTPYPKTMNRGGVIAGPYCDIKQKPEQEFTMEKTLETSIGKEVSRFLDAAKKMYQRGWVADHTTQIDADSGAKYSDLKNHKVPMHVQPSPEGPTITPADFHYIWVAECPANEYGEPNPHVHLLLRWSVPEPLFSPWAKRLEKIWGHGFAQLARIRKPTAASSYIIKAVGYAAKGANADQGLIRGNRYNIARCSRAPGWECLAAFETHNMTAIIREMGSKLEQWKKPLQRKIRKLNTEKAQAIKAKSIAKLQKKPDVYQNKLYQRIIRLEKTAQKISKTVRERGVHVSSANRFCISFDGENSKSKMDSFLLWAAGARGWSLKCSDIDMCDIKQDANEFYKKHYIRFKDRQAYWRSLADRYTVPDEPEQEQIDKWNQELLDYKQGTLVPMLC
ncbi:hypothetical protein [Vibrio methylphosphonaticus]|uniref:hypothetical protein n=1 Tax=Vibrio methylphosphonaticus TaxID=2946866 RepID=UPI00202A3645|nr:hypothetical protein [Vibrio methylphosphonaticus]MCL9775726.1 hypothetical protein [Vibrio methylphosphonaticus]